MAPTSTGDDALLRDLGQLTDRSRAAGRAVHTGLPLIGWGVAWLVGYPALDLTHGMLRVVLVVAVWLLAMACSWLPRSAVRTGWQRRLRIGWAMVFLAVPCLVAIVAPLEPTAFALFVGALWSLAMALHAVATGDPGYAAVSFVGVLAAGLATIQPWLPALVWIGPTAGLPLLVLGVLRWRRRG